MLKCLVIYDVEYSVDLQDWIPIAVDVAGTYEDTDAARVGSGVGFYRGIVR